MNSIAGKWCGRGVGLLVLAAAPGLAVAGVEVYGMLDAAVVLAHGGPAGSRTKLEAGVSNGSRIGVRGREDLGGGTTAIFTVETGILNDTGGVDQDGVLFGRQAFVGVQGRYGTLTLGRQYTPIFETLTDVDPFTNNYGGALGQLMTGEKAGTRQNNTVQFATPVLAGFSGQLAYGAGEAADPVRASAATACATRPASCCCAGPTTAPITPPPPMPRAMRC